MSREVNNQVEVQDGTAIAISNLLYAYDGGPGVLDIPDLTIHTSERVFLHGPSGSGKTTLLGVLGGILQPRAGNVFVAGSDISSMSPGARDQFRGRHIGFIFQMFNLIPYLSVLENILLPCMLSSSRQAKLGSTEPVEAARSLARSLGIENLLSKSVTALSVGQQQRVAAARAFIGDPEVVIADEPTSALDVNHREAFIKLLFQVCDASKATLVFVSHDQSLASLFNRNLSLASINRVTA